MSTFFERNYETNWDLDRPVDFEACATTVQNVVIVGNCKLRIDPSEWVDGARAHADLHVVYKISMPGVVIRRDKQLLVVFPSGKYILTGFAAEEEAGAFLLDVIRRYGFPIGPATLNDAKILNMVVTMRLPFKVCLDTLRNDADPLNPRTRGSTRRWLARADCHKISVVVGKRLVKRGSKEIEKMRTLSALVFASGLCILVGTVSTSERERFQRRVYNYLNIFSTGEQAVVGDIDEIDARLQQLSLTDDVDEMTVKLHKLTLQERNAAAAAGDRHFNPGTAEVTDVVEGSDGDDESNTNIDDDDDGDSDGDSRGCVWSREDHC